MPRCGLLIDVDGVLTVSWTPIVGAPGALQRLRDAGVPVVFVTNTTSVGRATIARSLREAGFAVEAEEILTAPAMTASLLRREFPGARCLVVGAGDITADLGDVTLVAPRDDPEVVVLGGAGDGFDYATLNRVFQLAASGVPVVAMHRNLSWATTEGLQLDTGAFLVGIERAAGVQATTVGKPAPACFAAGLELLGVDARDAWMVGDDLDADVRGAQGVGITGVLVRTGKFRPAVLEDHGPVPDHIVDSFADIPSLLDRAGVL